MGKTILFILHMPPPVHGAAMVGKYIHDSKRVNSAFDCHYVNLATAKDLADIGKAGAKKALRFLNLLRHIRAEVKRLRPDLVYVTPNAAGPAFYKDFVLVQMLKGMGCRVVCHYHNKGVAARADKIFDNLLYRKFFRGIKVILLADNLYADIKKYVNRDNVAICPNGIPDNGVRKRESPADLSSSLNILYLSNMMEEKGVWVLLDACRLLESKGVDFNCRFVGGWTDITEEELYEKAKSLGLPLSTPNHPDGEAKVAALGPRYGDEKEQCFAEADLFVFPTYYRKECFPLTLLEAMQSGLACISTDEAGIPDIIEDGKTGLVVPGKDSVALADAIERLANNRQLCREMGQAGRKRYDDFFTLKHFEDNLCKVLEDFATAK